MPCSGAMATASQRYFSFDLGRGDTEHLRTTFSVTLQIYALLALIVLLLAETAGLWLVNHKLVIPPARMTAWWRRGSAGRSAHEQVRSWEYIA